jgi:TRAP-type C4-dicarboxylate transport system permease small subunit
VIPGLSVSGDIMKNLYLRFNDALYMLCVCIAGLALLVITLIIPWGIFARYILGSGSSWPEPIAVLLVAVFTFLGAAACYRANGHIAVSMLQTRVSPAVVKYLHSLIDLCMAIVCLFMLIWGTKLCMATWEQFNNTLPWLRVGVAYASIPVGGGVTLLFVIEKILYGDQSQRRVVNLEHDTLLEGVE